MKHLKAWAMNSISSLIMFSFVLSPIFAEKPSKPDCESALIHTGKVRTRIPLFIGRVTKEALKRIVPRHQKTESIHSEVLSSMETQIKEINFPKVSQQEALLEDKSLEILTVLGEQLALIKAMTSEARLTDEEESDIQYARAQIGQILNFFLNNRLDLVGIDGPFHSQFFEIYSLYSRLQGLESSSEDY